MFDRVNGAAHFEVSDEDALRIYQELLSKLPGYLVPKLSVEIPGEKSKIMAGHRPPGK